MFWVSFITLLSIWNFGWGIQKITDFFDFFISTEKNLLYPGVLVLHICIIPGLHMEVKQRRLKSALTVFNEALPKYCPPPHVIFKYNG